MRLLTVRLTHSELSHLLSLIADNEREGTYYGNREQYWKRSDRIREKLLSQKHTTISDKGRACH